MLQSCCESNDVVDAVSDASGVDCETIYAAIVMIGCWPWSRAASVFSEILDREHGRHCQTPGESGILAGSKPEDSGAVGALVHVAMWSAWLGDVPLAVKADERPYPGHGSLRRDRHQLHLFMQDHA